MGSIARRLEPASAAINAMTIPLRIQPVRCMACELPCASMLMFTLLDIIAGRLQTRINLRVSGNFRLGEPLPTQECTTTFYPCIPERSCQRHAHAQVPSHRSPSVERFRIHVKGMVGSSGWLDGFPEVGRRRGPWRGRWAKDLLDASATGKNNSLQHGGACQSLCKNCNRAAAQPSL